MDSRRDFDIVVAGGGPAGSTTATMLVRKGWRVLLLEREHFPREHIGESLLPASLPILEELGALEAVEAAGFLRKPGATMVWGRDREPWSWFFRETNLRYPYAFQVWRATFDQLLLDNASGAGVDVRQGCRVLDVEFASGNAIARYIDPDGEEQRVSARYFVDATGQVGLLGRSMGLREADDQFRNLALYAYFEGGERLPGEAANSIFIESYEHGWSWLIPLHTGEASVGVVVDSATGQQAIREHGAEAAYEDQLRQAARTSAMLASATRTTGTRVIRDWSYDSKAMAGDGWVLAGDAACFIDPLFSSGVHLALSSGVLASAYVTTALKQPTLREEAARAYEALYRQQYRHFREMARLFYASNQSVESYFWEARRILDDETADPREAFVRAVAGQPPQGYERAVLERGDAPAPFRDAVAGVESERKRRAGVVARATAGPLPFTEFWSAAPALRPGLKLERSAVLGEGEFEPGYVLRQRPGDAGTPLSPLVAKALTLADGQRSVEAIVQAIAAEAPEGAFESVAQAVASAFRILYIDGTVQDMRGLEE